MAFKKAIANTNNTSPNLFVSLHGICHNVTNPKTLEKEYFTKVPGNVIAVMFTPTNHCVFSNSSSEQVMRHFLKNGDWIHNPEHNEGGMFQHTQVFMPGDVITNLNLDGDETTDFGVYKLDETQQRLPMTFDMEKKETAYDVERLLAELAPKNKKKTIVVYLFICSPFTISPSGWSTMKWTGRSAPSRKSTRQYDSFYITPEIAAMAQRIQRKREDIESAAKARFKKMVYRQNKPFTRSMNFPVELRNGSTDHIPQCVGHGIGYESISKNKCGIYYEIDKSDRKNMEKFREMGY
jgi:hypothetical protein